MANAVEEAVLNALRGHQNENIRFPTPRIVKVYISSLKNGNFLLINQYLCAIDSYPSSCKLPSDFKEERKVLLEVVGPELQSIYDDRQIEVSMHLTFVRVNKNKY